MGNIGIDASGESLLRSADFSMFVSAIYEFDLTSGSIPASVTCSHKGDFPYDFIADPLAGRLKQDDCGVLNARVAYVAEDESWSVGVWAQTSLTRRTRTRSPPTAWACASVGRGRPRRSHSSLQFLFRRPAARTVGVPGKRLEGPYGANLDRVQIVKGWLLPNGDSAEPAGLTTQCRACTTNEVTGGCRRALWLIDDWTPRAHWHRRPLCSIRRPADGHGGRNRAIRMPRCVAPARSPAESPRQAPPAGCPDPGPARPPSAAPATPWIMERKGFCPARAAHRDRSVDP